jgi:hypothetical protein
LAGEKLEKKYQRGGQKDNFWKICLYIKGSPLNYKNEVLIFEIQILDNSAKVVAFNTRATVNSPNKLKISSPKLWSTSNPLFI